MLKLLYKLLLLILLQKPLLILFFPSLHCPLLCFPLCWFGAGLLLHALDPDLLELLGDFPQDRVDADVWPLVEGLLAHGTLIQRAGLPVSQNAVLAKVVSTGDRNRVGEDVQTNGAVHLLFRQIPSGGHSCTAERRVSVSASKQL